MEPLQSHDPGNKSEGLVRVNIHLFLKHFFNNFFDRYFFRFPIYKIIPISCPELCVWFVDSRWLSNPLKAVFVIFLLLWQVLKTYIFKVAYNKLFDRIWIQSFIGCELFNIWSCLEYFSVFAYFYKCF